MSPAPKANHQNPEGSTKEKMIAIPAIMEMQPGKLPRHLDLRIKTTSRPQMNSIHSTRREVVM